MDAPLERARPLGLLTREDQVETVDGQNGETDGAVAVGGVAHVGWVEPLERGGWIQRDAVCGVSSVSRRLGTQGSARLCRVAVSITIRNIAIF